MRRAALCLLPLAVFMAAPSAWAVHAPVKIEVEVIAATTDKNGIDPRLAKFRDRFNELKFTSYQILSDQIVTLALAQDQTIRMPGGYVLEISPRLIEPSGLIRMHLHVHGSAHEKIIDAEYAIAPGGDLLLGGMKFRDGALLVALHHSG